MLKRKTTGKHKFYHNFYFWLLFFCFSQIRTSIGSDSCFFSTSPKSELLLVPTLVFFQVHPSQNSTHSQYFLTSMSSKLELLVVLILSFTPVYPKLEHAIVPSYFCLSLITQIQTQNSPDIPFLSWIIQIITHTSPDLFLFILNYPNPNA